MISDYDSIVAMYAVLGMWKSFHISCHVIDIKVSMDTNKAGSYLYAMGVGASPHYGYTHNQLKVTS
jgi:hypothetical protein